MLLRPTHSRVIMPAAITGRDSFGLQASGNMAAARQDDNELGERSGLGHDVDGPAMLFDNDVVGHWEAEPGPFAAVGSCL